MEKIKTRHINIYNYADFIGGIVLPEEIEIYKGCEVEVNFDNPEIVFLEGIWERPVGTYEFTIFALKDMDSREKIGLVQLPTDDMW